MNPLARYILTWLALLCPLIAQVPTKPPLSRYSSLWLNSPFTSKPERQVTAERANPFEDYTLTGIAPVPGGYRITIVSKKNRELKKVIEPGRDSEFQVVSVERNPDVSLGTTVTLSDGRVRGTVRFEPDTITLNTPPPATRDATPSGMPPGMTQPPPPNAQQGDKPRAQPRRRIVPVPPAQNSNTSNQNRQQRRGQPPGN